MSGLAWLESELELSRRRESWVKEAVELVDGYELAGGGSGGELLKPSQINALAREAAKGKEDALAFIKRQASRGRNKRKWNEKNGGGKSLAERLREIIEEITAVSPEGPEDEKAEVSRAVSGRAPAAFASLLRAAYNVRRSESAGVIGREAGNDETGASHRA